MDHLSSVFVDDIVGVRTGPLAEHLDAYAALVKEQGFTPDYIRRQIRLLASFSEWLQRGRRQLGALDESVIERFLCRRPDGRQFQKSDEPTLARLVGMLRNQGITPEKPEPAPSPVQKTIAEYRRYLLGERGLSTATALNRAPFVERFLTEISQQGELKFAQLRVPDVTSFVQRHADKAGSAYAQHLVQALRSFLRYLRLQGKIKTDLAGCVPPVAAWSLARLPKFLPADSVQKVIDSPDQQTAVGRRDRAVLLLLARLGLRACEVIHLTLDDIDWDNATITVRGKGGRWSRMPLPVDVGEAIALYLRQDRRRCSCRRVFLCDKAPIRGFENPSAISTLVRRAIEKAGVDSTHKGAHVFRHSLATEMLRQRASLDEIGELLRHKSPNTTAIYAKVDLAALRPLALSWPGGAR
jgi:site-specific recombinase XerD